MMDRKEIATHAIREAAYAVRREEIIASRMAGETISYRQTFSHMRFPALADAEVVGHWAGLRPGSPEGIPNIGEVPGYSGLWLNCGHFRNGLVLAPASCQLLADLMLGREPIVDPAPYAPAGRLGVL